MTYYRRRLAGIHHADFSEHAKAAARQLLAELGDDRGLVIDLGCGAGDLAPEVTAAGFDYLGLDTSPNMLVLARNRHPGARFEQRSAFDIDDLPPARAIVAVGEVINYGTDPRAGAAGLYAWLRACHRLLGPGGVLLFDAAGPMRADPDPVTRVFRGDGYQMSVIVATDPQRRTLTRTIRISDATGEETETHVLHLVDPMEVMAALRRTGFDVTPLAGYDPQRPFPRGWSGFLARVILGT